MDWKKWVALIIAALIIGFAVGHYGFDSPPPAPYNDKTGGPGQ